MLTVYKASAGSGKTFQLVVEYLKILLHKPFQYKHILAVTFTNKATNEMKSRILETLNEIASGKPSKYIPEIQKENNLTEEQIRKNAKLVLRNILHDYNRFSINTIDSFTQRTIKAFNRELGISPNYRLELNTEIILSEATDRMLSKIGNDKKLLKWLIDFSREKIEDNKSQRIETDIKSLGKELFKENFQMFFPDDKETVYTRENLISFGKELRGIKSNFESKLKTLGKKGATIIADNGLSIDDFSGKSRGPGSLFSKYESGYLKEISPTAKNAIESTEKWYTKNSPKKAEIHALVESKLQPLLIEIADFISQNEALYFSSLAVLKQLRMLGILTDLKEEIKNLLHEKGVMQISDANMLLSKIIGNSDSPFIYEKTGNYYHHFMLDEFQDTSGLQWNNFKPLVQNSLAEGNKNLLVGDVKQSIYRWRNSNYKILAEQIYSDFSKEQLKEIQLGKNWRSDKNIIYFNNHIFYGLKSAFEENLFNDFENDKDVYLQQFRNIYDGIEQIPGDVNAEQKGLAKICFLDQEEFVQNSSSLLVEQVKQLQNQGIKASDIAILVRKNKEGTPIIESLLAASNLPENKNYNLSVLSNESLFLISSQAVLTIIDIINLIIIPDNKIVQTSLLNHWMYWLKPELIKRGKIDSEEVDKDKTEVIPDVFDKNYKTLFENELSSKLEQLMKKVLLTSLDEAIIEICSVFQLFNLETELPFIQTLIDKAGELKSSLSNDLSNFLYWWNESGQKTSVNVNEEIDSINLLTVHKSKGLEFKAVIIPYFDWDLKPPGNFSPVLWCKTQAVPFNKFPLLPVKYSKDLVKSVFKDYYFEETTNNIIDTFNLSYVSFTRAQSALIIHCPKPKPPKNKNESDKTLKSLFYNSLENLSVVGKFNTSWNDEKTIFQFGNLPKDVSTKEASKSLLINNYSFYDFSERVKLRNSGEDFLVEGENRSATKNKGKLIHDILSSVKKYSDIELACSKALSTGIINEVELSEIKDTLESAFKNPFVTEWFNGKYKVVNERNMITEDRILRPDRIMLFENEAIVVDYKTGEKKSDKYNSQVKRYAKILKQTGFDKVRGYLWYINQNDVEQVCEL